MTISETSGVQVEESIQMGDVNTASQVMAQQEQAVCHELGRILGSRFFKSAGRSRQFLQYVVKRKLEGHSDELKEHTIGTEVFHRPVGYTTGDDSVVRVQAGGVRRRLEQFYQSEGKDSALRIELPLGSYCPEFHWVSTEEETGTEVVAPKSPVIEVPQAPAKRRFLMRITAIGVAAALVIAVSVFIVLQKKAAGDTILRHFWGPVFSTQQPALICLAKGVTYRPGPQLYARYESTHPGTFRNKTQKANIPLPLDANENLKWDDLLLYPDYGVPSGEVYAAVRISSVLGELRKTTQLRIGKDYSYEDLRNSPAAIIGAFNNQWSMDLTSNLHFAFYEQDGRNTIRELTPNGRQWPLASDNLTNEPGRYVDYALVGRLVDSRTGQFTVILGGLRGAGTESASEFVSDPQLLERAFRGAPSGWESKSSLFVLKTTVIDSVAGPPVVIASYFW